MEIAEVVDQRSLAAHLEELIAQDRETGLLTARRIAFLAALRVADLGLRYFSDKPASSYTDRLTPLPQFAAIAIARLAAEYPTLPIEEGAKIAVYEAANLSARAVAPTGLEDVESSAQAAAHAAKGDAVTAVGNAAYAANSNQFWNTVCADLALLAKDPTGILPPLLEGEPPVALTRAWRETSAILSKDESGHWGFWIAWYERVLAGKDLKADALAKVLNTLTEADLEGDPGEVNQRFDEVLRSYRRDDLFSVVKATPMGEDIAFAPRLPVLVLHAKDRVSATYLDNIIANLQSAIDLFSDETAHNFAGALRREIRILERTVSDHAKRPVLILQDCRRVLDRLDLKERTGDLPSAQQDADILDFRGILNRSQLDLIALSPDVKEYHEATKPLAGDADLALIADAAEIAAQAGDDELASILRNTAEILRDPKLTDEERRLAFYAAASRLSRMYRVAQDGPEASSGGKSVGERIEELRWFTSNPQVQDAISTIVRIFVGVVG